MLQSSAIFGQFQAPQITLLCLGTIGTPALSNSGIRDVLVVPGDFNKGPLIPPPFL